MDATTQLANDVHFLTAPLRFIWRSILWTIFLLIAPVLYLTVPFILIVLTPNNGVFPMLAFAYMALGPFVSAFWTMIVCMIRRHRRMTADGSPYERSLGGVVAAFGFMFFGFFGSLAAEVGFVLLFHGVSKGPLVFFSFAPFAVFAPLLLLWARNTYAGL